MEFRLAGKVRVDLWLATAEFRLGGFLVDTPYQQQCRCLPEFEPAYRIFKEEGFADNPISIADTMVALESYKAASKHDPNELHPVPTRWENPQPQHHNPQTNIFIGSIHNLDDPQTRRLDRRPQSRRLTWGEQIETHYRCIAGNMISQRNLIP